MKKVVFFIFLAFNITSAQDFTDSWEGLFSFTTIVDIDESATAVYAASENAVFVYDLSSRTFTTLTTVNGLSGDEISQIHYSEDKSLLVIGYENGLLQIVDQNGDVTDVVAIKDKQVIPPDNKKVNEFLESGDLIYIATDFGIAIYNLERLEFDDTYFIGNNGEQVPVSSLEIFNGFLYAATLDASNNLRRAPIADPFLIDFMNWQQVNPDVWDEVIAFDAGLFAVTVGGFLAEFNGTTFANNITQFPSRVLDASATNDFLVFTLNNQIIIYDTSLSQFLTLINVNGESFEFTQAIVVGDDLFIGTEVNGMIRVNLLNQTDFEFIVADGPSRNAAFSIQTLPEELWVTYGSHDIFYTPDNAALGISHFVEGGWINYTNDDIDGLLSVPTITINPENPTDLVVHSMNNGLLDFIDGVASTRYGINNSSLTSILPPSTFFVRIPDGEYDSQGNLWVIQQQVDFALSRRNPSGNWTAFDVGSVFEEVPSGSSTTKLVITNDDKIIFGSTDGGLIGYDPTLDQFTRLTDEVSEGNLINPYVSALRIDQRNQLWIGSNLGLRVLFNVNSLFSDEIQDARSIIIEDTNGIPRELLQDEAVLDIEIDGNNNKWVATASSGAFLFSPSGRETLFQFTTDNSPLPTNSVNDIAIDEETGKVYFATNKGIVAFQGERSSKPQENLESIRVFPNPVRPGFDGNVTIDGLTERARVKITDIEGNLVYEAVSQGGSIPWDTRSFSGNKVASGVYLLFISTSDNIETTVSKVMIVR
ncbi:putative secreted protein (Por secretion system target) [Nonlabens dokdonensis]|uniref:Immunoreactive 84 kDa antigen n=2 Tax=Nonlabens dokdonensis TaxID=328515 RepID=L7W770_NONDD|nr:T9SS type A sorting domain-containing protein [Nonlabens dokdonensis]AGC76047.1 immunoreactive 84 kDa antigen [Nonlabens dokdonensis DSW-6]PZX43719.1 putative secreted protein (Por secretion system target) [Nonlabens dokdonensis]